MAAQVSRLLNLDCLALFAIVIDTISLDYSFVNDFTSSLVRSWLVHSQDVVKSTMADFAHFTTSTVHLISPPTVHPT